MDAPQLDGDPQRCERSEERHDGEEDGTDITLRDVLGRCTSCIDRATGQPRLANDNGVAVGVKDDFVTALESARVPPE